MKRFIRKVAVLGSGVMGSRIACHFANVGCEVLLLDIPPKELDAIETKKGLTLDSKSVRNRIVNQSLQFALKSNPSPIYRKSFATRIETGNFDDDLQKIKDCDWVIEVIVERLDIKQQLFEKVERHRTAGSLISSNTSGIPIHMMLEGRSEDFQKHFCGTHFFNPPRYLQLLEIIPTPKTDNDVVDFLMDYGSKILGKKTVLCKDTPAFIANRVGVYSIMALFHAVKEMGFSVSEVDKLSGPILGRPKSATFRTCDVVGLDTLVHVANGLKQNCLDDEERELFELPDYISKMVENNWLGSKSGQGFYKKTKDENGKKTILALDLDTLEYKKPDKVKFPTLEMAKPIEDLRQRTKMLVMGMDKAGEFYRRIFGGLLAYVSNRIPEISDEFYKIDDALKAGFGWELGPFESWDLFGFEKGVKYIKDANKQMGNAIDEMREAGMTSFYKSENGRKMFFDMASKSYKVIPGTEKLVDLNALREDNKVWGNSDCTLVHLGEGILNLEFHTKMNTIGGGVLQGINKSIDIAENEYKGLVISNTGQNFSAGANVGMIFMMAADQDFDELNFAVKAFQDTTMRIRYSNIPVIVAPHNMALGGGCEISLHADKVVAHAELYMGLVEFGVGLIPGGGGTKEFAKRLSDELHSGDIKINRLRDRFLTVGQAKVSMSAYEAFDYGYLREGIDEVVVSRDHQLARAKAACIELSEKGYVPPKREKNITVVGQEGLGIVYVGANSMLSGNYMSEHDRIISEKLGFVLCGGDLSENTVVSEQYLLDLERKAFLELCKEKKTLERIESIVKYGKILRN
ncbi:MAG: 3-hydroxyacyl-CoA dehydrogenase/enoyl-CoA hydratase family protein [Crocinitomicaceae bacterium]|nr:3-hydroxyacyl-CoA dehydrogenase/enoyl-CoA hydratase family protein [Crocinitomicaceae bacterium]MDG1350793.1 3-hydroxyacyl-CoA dehydrogenase/enoyl-CoA hydratase family protein [Crocinitomicaceae bacterium]MDG1734877.1 3-hydroxyacyl-CoA dehydrogenase/enoyl-CoA hydratase family protein [Crocinitomicaceae bacterium]MDG2505339.1 3-hydroxyacyl-CoA dehydrogenase/enoyl-CoA hydratase family protein [Crocinitomicaceae bacterium]